MQQLAHGPVRSYEPAPVHPLSMSPCGDPQRHHRSPRRHSAVWLSGYTRRRSGGNPRMPHSEQVDAAADTSGAAPTFVQHASAEPSARETRNPPQASCTRQPAPGVRLPRGALRSNVTPLPFAAQRPSCATAVALQHPWPAVHAGATHFQTVAPGEDATGGNLSCHPFEMRATGD